MARVDTDEVTVLTAFVNLLLTAFDSLSPSSCFLTLDPGSTPDPPGGNFWLTVSGGPSTIDEEMQDDAGDDQVVENQIIRIGIFTRIKLDKVGYDVSLLTDATRSLKVIKKQVLAVLVDEDPQDGDGNTFLWETIKATGSEGSNHDQTKGVGWEILNFRAIWSWSLG